MVPKHLLYKQLIYCSIIPNTIPIPFGIEFKSPPSSVYVPLLLSLCQSYWQETLEISEYSHQSSKVPDPVRYRKIHEYRLFFRCPTF